MLGRDHVCFGFFSGDPNKAARAILGVFQGRHSFRRLPLGTDCVRALEDKIGQLQRDLEAAKEISASTLMLIK